MTGLADYGFLWTPWVKSLPPLVYVSVFRASSQPIKSLPWLPSPSSEARVNRVAQGWWLIKQNTGRGLIWMVGSLHLAGKKLLEPWEAAFCLVTPLPSSFPGMFAAQAKAARKSCGGRGARDGIWQGQGACLPQVLTQSLPKRRPLGSTYLRPSLCDRARNLKTLRTSKQIFRSGFPF